MLIVIVMIIIAGRGRREGRALRRAARARGARARGHLYEEFTRLAETRLAQNILNYS